MRKFIKKLAQRFGYDISIRARPRLAPPSVFDRANEIVSGSTMLSETRQSSLFDQVLYCEQMGIEGAIVECGVWKGGAMGLAALALLHASVTPNRKLHLFDAFTDICAPDPAVDGSRAMREFGPTTSSANLQPVEGAYDSIGGHGTVAACRELIETRIGYPASLVEYHVGWFQDVLPMDAPKLEPIAILRLDGDWYASTKVYYRGRALGTFGNMAAFSFHETKNVISGEGGALHINDSKLVNRAEIVREKGTNRSSFFRGEVNKYGWVDVGSSYLPSDITAAFLYAQLEACDTIQARRLEIWEGYRGRLADIEEAGDLLLPRVPGYATNNGHMFYLVCPSLDVRTKLIEGLKAAGIMAVFHYQSLHNSQYYAPKHDGRVLPNADRYTDCLLRLPLYYELTDVQVENIAEVVRKFFGQ